MIGHLRRRRTGVTNERRVVLHKMSGGRTHFGAILEHLNVGRLSMVATSFLALLGRLRTDCGTIQRILNALLHLHLSHRLIGILLHKFVLSL